MPIHTSKEFEQELTTLRERLMTMAARAESQIAAAMRAVAERDAASAAKVVEADDLIDRDELEIDELAQTILATRQPVASDLRFITMTLKFVTDLERIGDLAANIAKRAQELSCLPVLDPAVDFTPLATGVERNLRGALESFVHRDAETAAGVIDADREIDQLNKEIFAQLLGRIAAEPDSAAQVIPLTSIARSLERIGDHAKNLAEQVVYLVRGRDVRHRRSRRE